MRQPNSAPQSARRDGWTPRRQLAFLDVLARTRSVTRAARAVGMSRESAYRLRRRPSAALFAAAWDRALERPAGSQTKGHSRVNIRSIGRPLKIGGFPRFPIEGHKVEDPLFSIIARRQS